MAGSSMRSIRWLWAWGAALAFAQLVSAAQSAGGAGLAVLELEQALPRIGKSGEPEAKDLELDLALREGRWEETFIGTTVIIREPRYALATAFNKCEAEGKVISQERRDGRTILAVRLVIPKDVWGTAGGVGEYAIEFTQSGDALEGTYTGTFNDKPAKGKVTGKLHPAFSTPVTGLAPVGRQEHPRLVFRKAGLPRMKENARTAEGQAILARLTKLLSGPINGDNAGYHAAGHGLLHLLNDDPAEAQAAQEIVEKVLFGKGYGRNPWYRNQEKERIIRAPIAIGITLAYDLCYDAWPEDFRQRVTKQLEQKARDLIDYVGRDDYNDNYPSNHVGICQGAGGLAALAILGEPGEYYPKPVAPTGNVQTPIAPDAGYKPGKGVPVVKLELGKMPLAWLFAGPLKPESMDRDFLAADGGREKARPEEGTRVKGDSGEAVFAKLDPAKGIYNSKHTGDTNALDLVEPIGRDYHSTVIYYTVIENDRPRLVRYLCEHGGTVAFLAGQRILPNSYLKLEKGLYPLLLQIGVGETQPWGKIWATPHFVEATEKEIQDCAARYGRELAEWEAGLKQWEAEDKPIPTVRRLLDLAAFRMRKHVEYSTGDHGWYNEGDGYNRYSQTNGVLPFEVAWRTAMGEHFGGGKPGCGWYVPMLASRILKWGGKAIIPWYGPGGPELGGDIWRSGDFVMGFGVTPDGLKPACRWVFDRVWGLDGDKTFGMYEPHQAVYAMAHYPFGVEARNPDGILPRAFIDRDKGYVHFRSRWQDDGDYLACIYAKSEPTGGGWSYADGAAFRVFGRGTMWARKGGTPKDGGYEFENVVRVPGANGWLGAQVTHFAPRPDGGGVVSMDTSDIHLVRVGSKDAAPAPEGARTVAGNSVYVDYGIRGLRSLAVDYSGKSGAEALVVVADRVTVQDGGKLPAGEPVWQMFCGGEVAVKDNTFTVRGKDGFVLHGTFIAPAEPRLTVTGDKLTAEGREFLVIMTIRKGDPAAVKVQGTGLSAQITVGAQAVSFDGARVVLGE